MDEADVGIQKSETPLARERVNCILAYGLIWSFAFGFLWFLVNADAKGFSSPEHLGQFILSLAWTTLCPDWPFLLCGVLLGAFTCLSAPTFSGAVRSSLIGSLLPVGVVCVFFNFTLSAFLPALVAVLSSLAAGSIVARPWQQTLSAVPYTGRLFAAKRVLTVVVSLLALSVPFRLLEWAGAVWSRSMGTEVTETNAAVSPDGAYIATIHDVNPGAVGDYSDVIIRPRHTVLNLFADYSASSRYMGVDHIQWLGKHTLTIWRSYDAGTNRWNDMRIVYIDTRNRDDQKEDAPMNAGSAHR